MQNARVSNDGHVPQTGILLGASDHLTQSLERLTKKVTLKAGEMLFDQGTEGDALYTVESGSVEISVVANDGRKLSLAVMGRGQMLGEIALFDQGLRTAGASAIEKTVLRKIERAELFFAIKRDPQLALDMIELAGKRLRDVSKQLHEQVFLQMHTRLARKILHLTEGETLPSKVLKMSQGDLADFVGASREAVSKTLSIWRKQNIVDVGRGTVTINDRAALRELAALDFF